MAHFAKVLDGKVVQVIVAEPQFMNTFVDTAPGTWLQASYNTRGGVHYAPNSNEPDGGLALRKNYPGLGWSYDDQLDAFIPPQPFASWTLNADTCTWDPPTPYPTDGADYIWDETAKAWVPVDNPS